MLLHNACVELRAVQINANGASFHSPLVCSNATLYGNVSDVSGARLGQRSTQGRNQRKEVRDSGGTRLEHDKSEPTLRDILLVLDPPIHGHEDMEPSFASGAEQDAILHA